MMQADQGNVTDSVRTEVYSFKYAGRHTNTAAYVQHRSVIINLIQTCPVYCLKLALKLQ